MICPALDAIRLPLTNERWLLIGAAFIEPARTTHNEAILEARNLARDAYIDGACHEPFPRTFRNPYPSSDILHDIWREALHCEGKDLYQLLDAFESAARKGAN